MIIMKSHDKYIDEWEKDKANKHKIVLEGQPFCSEQESYYLSLSSVAPPSLTPHRETHGSCTKYYKWKRAMKELCY